MPPLTGVIPSVAGTSHIRPVPGCPNPLPLAAVVSRPLCALTASRLHPYQKVQSGTSYSSCREDNAPHGQHPCSHAPVSSLLFTQLCGIDLCIALYRHCNTKHILLLQCQRLCRDTMGRVLSIVTLSVCSYRCLQQKLGTSNTSQRRTLFSTQKQRVTGTTSGLWSAARGC